MSNPLPSSRLMPRGKPARLLDVFAADLVVQGVEAIAGFCKGPLPFFWGVSKAA